MATVQKVLRPIKRLGYRNVFCKLYNDCLDFAVDKKWLHFACPRTCPLIEDQGELTVRPSGNASLSRRRPTKLEFDG
ncbi:MAG: hypothetical protein HY788_14855 [Deltaproteobacteria bacterium]|nr:hypothetical protein [Deltaproteobacteria bacterium]